MKKVIFKGAGVAIVTPFNEYGIDYEELKKLIDFHIKNDVSAIIITGTTGESPTLTDDEHKECIKFAVEYVSGRVPVVAGTGSNDTEYAIQLSKYAEEVGVDGLLVVTPYYNKTSQKGLIEHFKSISDSVNIPIILYNVPSRTGVNIEPSTYLELSKIENIVATKEASGDLSQVLKTRALCGENLNIYSGNDDQIVAMLSLGSIGVISVLSNIMPKETSEMCKAYFEGDTNRSLELQVELCLLIESLLIEVNPIPVKSALNLMGFNVGHLRRPLTSMDDKNLIILKNELKKHNLI